MSKGQMLVAMATIIMTWRRGELGEYDGVTS